MLYPAWRPACPPIQLQPPDLHPERSATMKHDLPAVALAPRPELRGAAGAVILFAAVAALYFARDILIPFAFALTLTFLLTPVVALLQRLHIGRA